MGEIVFSSQQNALFDWVANGHGSVFLQARAGTGKTTTIIEACRYMKGSLAFAAYNKKIADEIRDRLVESGVDTSDKRAGTFHSFGWASLRRIYQNARVDDKKIDTIMDDLRIPVALNSFTKRLVSLAKNQAVGLYDHPDDPNFWWGLINHHDLISDLEDVTLVKKGIECSREVLERSNQIVPAVVDFDDMIYIPAIKNVQTWQNDWLLVDEAQDTNQARRALARKMLKPGGRSIWVGDDRQAIYGFTGADDDAVERIIREFDCETLPLTVTYRCPPEIVAEAQKIVPDIVSASPNVGLVERISLHDLLTSQGLSNRDAILCRKTAPLVSLAFTLIRQGTPCHVEGRDIGNGLKKLACRWKVKKLDVLLMKLEDYRESEVKKLMAKGRETMAEAVADRVETLLIVAEGCSTIRDLLKKLDALFVDGKMTLTLSTVHKAKGREWDRVFILGRFQFMPSNWARQQWQKRQEQNLIYVSVTRAKETLKYVDC